MEVWELLELMGVRGPVRITYQRARLARPARLSLQAGGLRGCLHFQASATSSPARL